MSYNNAWTNGGVPPRWLNCPRKGHPIYYFLPFKTPLSKRYDNFVPLSNRFTVSMVFQSVASQGRRIVTWIDLTKTDRFYSADDVREHDANYVKIKLTGHDETPNEGQCQRFYAEVAKAMQHINHLSAQQTNTNPLIGVHCTHGFNRTGFLICSYLVTHLNWDLSAAIQAFASVRPPGIYKQDYIDELYKRYEGAVPSDLPIIELPKWCFEEESSSSSGPADSQPSTSSISPLKHTRTEIPSSSDDDDDDDPVKKSRVGDDESDTVKPDRQASASTVVKKATFIKPNAKFMDGQVRNVDLLSDYQEIVRVQQKVQQLCGREVGSTGGTSGFPGGQPVSLAFGNMDLLAQQRYKVSWKADGVRYMMYIQGQDQVYMVDRDNTIFQVPNLRFPHRKDPAKHLSNTLLDGEMVVDKVNGQDIPRYLIYDVIQFFDQEVGKCKFDVRTKCIQNEIIEPRNLAIQRGDIDKTSEPFSIRIKQFYDMAQARTLLDESFARQLTHKMDGLVFQPVDEPYKSGTWHSLLKWKPPTENSIDFRLRIFTKREEGSLPEKRGVLYVNGLSTPVAEIRLTKELLNCDDKIVECFFDFAKNEWQFMRVRTDKSHPNAYSVVQNILSGIQRPVTEQVLVDYIAGLGQPQAGSNQGEAPYTAGAGNTHLRARTNSGSGADFKK